MCVAGQASMTQTLRWRLGCSIYLGREGSRTGQRDKLCGDAATTEASTNPAELSAVGAKGPGFIHPEVYQRFTWPPQGTGVWPWVRQLGLSCELATPTIPTPRSWGDEQMQCEQR